MEEITVFLFDVDFFGRDDVTKQDYNGLLRLEELNPDAVQVYSLLEFQEAFNDEMIDDVNNWIVFAKKD